ILEVLDIFFLEVLYLHPRGIQYRLIPTSVVGIAGIIGTIVIETSRVDGFRNELPPIAVPLGTIFERSKKKKARLSVDNANKRRPTCGFDNEQQDTNDLMVTESNGGPRRVVVWSNFILQIIQVFIEVIMRIFYWLRSLFYSGSQPVSNNGGVTPQNDGNNEGIDEIDLDEEIYQKFLREDLDDRDDEEDDDFTWTSTSSQIVNEDSCEDNDSEHEEDLTIPGDELMLLGNDLREHEEQQASSSTSMTTTTPPSSLMHSFFAHLMHSSILTRTQYKKLSQNNMFSTSLDESSALMSLINERRMPRSTSQPITDRPFDLDYPSKYESTVRDGPVRCISFNKRGTMLAGGCSDGFCIVWDFQSMSIIRKAKCHSFPVTGVSWSRNGHCVLSCGEDEKCVYWDLAKGAQKVVHFGLLRSSFVGDSSMFVVSLFQELPVIVELGDDTIRHFSLPTNSDTPSEMNLSVLEKMNSSKDVIVQTLDKTIRLYWLDDQGLHNSELLFAETVNKNNWNQCCFSQIGEYIIGGSAKVASHEIYIWDIGTARLVQTLQGPYETLIDLAQHPVQPVIVSLDEQGAIHTWTTRHKEDWVNWDPGFTEIHDNIVYEEREDEFDVMSDDENFGVQSDQVQEVIDDEEIDVATVDRPENSDSSDDGEDFLNLYDSGVENTEIYTIARNAQTGSSGDRIISNATNLVQSTKMKEKSKIRVGYEEETNGWTKRS
ncbi:16669_t:CDS:2, partial [Acaulospora colombiana]